MVEIKLSFPSGRYHANPWGRHVNEGVAEWPPSPYRLLRALYDAWKRKCPSIPEARVDSLFRSLASTPPSFHLPPALASHTRSYLAQNSKDPSDKALVFDGFVALSRSEPVRLLWPTLELDDVARQDLSQLLAALNYLGRSESWVSAVLGEGNVHPNCSPASGSEGATIPVACPLPADEFVPTAKLTWLDALATTTTQIQKSKASRPPAMKSVDYSKPELEHAIIRPRASRKEQEVNGVLYALDSKVLPSVHRSIDVAERARYLLMGINKRDNGDTGLVSHRFSGKLEDASPLANHEHCFFLPLSRERTGKVDHLLVYSRQSLERGEIRSLTRFRSLKGFAYEIDLVPVLLGDLSQLLTPARIFRSATPFVPPRFYRKGRGDWQTWIQNELGRECANHGLPEPIRVSPWLSPDHWRAFRRNRLDEAPRYGAGFEIEFATPVSGPFSIGYACHFGLGLFTPSL